MSSAAMPCRPRRLLLPGLPPASVMLAGPPRWGAMASRFLSASSTSTTSRFLSTSTSCRFLSTSTGSRFLSTSTGSRFLSTSTSSRFLSTSTSSRFSTASRCSSTPPLPRSSISLPRLFTSSLRLRTAAPATTPSHYALVKRLATKPTPTVLYEAPSHFWFYFGCWSSGLFLLSWTALTAQTVVNQPEGVPQWVSVVYGTAYLLLYSMGLYLIFKTRNIVSCIRVLPAPPPSATAVHSLAAPRLELTVRRMLPLLEPKVLTTSLDGAALKTRFSLPDACVPELNRADEARRAALRKADMDHLLTMPFRRLGRGLGDMFRGVRAAWTDLGYGIIRVDGKQYKVDVTKGFAHDGFRTLERIVPIGWK